MNVKIREDNCGTTTLSGSIIADYSDSSGRPRIILTTKNELDRLYGVISWSQTGECHKTRGNKKKEEATLIFAWVCFAAYSVVLDLGPSSTFPYPLSGCCNLVRNDELVGRRRTQRVPEGNLCWINRVTQVLFLLWGKQATKAIIQQTTGEDNLLFTNDSAVCLFVTRLGILSFPVTVLRLVQPTLLSITLIYMAKWTRLEGKVKILDPYIIHNKVQPLT